MVSASGSKPIAFIAFDSMGTRCNECMKEVHAEQIVEVSRLGHVATLGPDAQAKRAAIQRKFSLALWHCHVRR
jgi:hypothetical protein